MIFLFFGTSVALLEAELALFKDWEEICHIWGKIIISINEAIWKVAAPACKRMLSITIWKNWLWWWWLWLWSCPALPRPTLPFMKADCIHHCRGKYLVNFPWNAEGMLFIHPVIVGCHILSLLILPPQKPSRKEPPVSFELFGSVHTGRVYWLGRDGERHRRLSLRGSEGGGGGAGGVADLGLALAGWSANRSPPLPVLTNGSWGEAWEEWTVLGGQWPPDGQLDLTGAGEGGGLVNPNLTEPTSIWLLLTT